MILEHRLIEHERQNSRRNQINSSPAFWMKITQLMSKPGFTHRNDRCDSFSRIDYFVTSDPLYRHTQQNINMSVCNWITNKDHARITLSFIIGQYTENAPEQYGKAWSIPQPDLCKITPSLAIQCKKEANQSIHKLNLEFETAMKIVTI